ncbi:MAG: ABC transporter permease subunit [Streptosporangiales bacterium]|nr:ABC transporter permease subunit [Streptosporangiales bacterium]
MGRYVLRRLLQAIPVFIGTTFLIFAMFHFMPGDPIRAMFGDKPPPEAQYQALREHYNLDKPLWQRYLLYMGGIFKGDFGETFNQRPVSEIMKERWPVTLQLSGTAWALELVFVLFAGVWAGLRRGRAPDYGVLMFATLFIAVPSFVIGLVVQVLNASVLHNKWHFDVFPVAGITEGWPMSYLLPGFILALLGMGQGARLMRTSLTENLRADYVRTATAKGLTRKRVIMRHALRNSLIPVVTLEGVSLGLLMGGAIITEGIFNLPGIGNEVFLAISRQEFTIATGIVTLFVLIFILINLLVDLLYAVLDPRIRYD